MPTTGEISFVGKWMHLVLLLLVLVVGITIARALSKLKKGRWWVGPITIFSLAWILGSVIRILYPVALWPIHLGEGLAKMRDLHAAHPWTQWLTLAAAAGTGWFLHLMKRHAPAIFGFLEMTAGISTVWFSFSQKHDNDTIFALTFAGGIFLIATGLDDVRPKERASKEKRSGAKPDS